MTTWEQFTSEWVGGYAARLDELREMANGGHPDTIYAALLDRDRAVWLAGQADRDLAASRALVATLVGALELVRDSYCELAHSEALSMQKGGVCHYGHCPEIRAALRAAASADQPAARRAAIEGVKE